MPMAVAMIAAAVATKPIPIVPPLIHGLLHSALLIWPIWVLIGAIGAGRLAYDIYRWRQPRRRRALKSRNRCD
jgi:hypothetical protein